MPRYRNLLPVLINGEFGQGDIFDADLPESEEADHLTGGLLEIIPATYKVIADARVFDTAQGDTFERALTIGEERFLVDGGFVERLPDEPLPEKEPVAPKPRRKKRTEKESTG